MRTIEPSLSWDSYHYVLTRALKAGGEHLYDLVRQYFLRTHSFDDRGLYLL